MQFVQETLRVLGSLLPPAKAVAPVLVPTLAPLTAAPNVNQ
jgi:hypothetical protein